MIVVSDVSYSTNHNQILQNIHTTIRLGHITAILGPNGAGKSTFLQCLTGSLKPTSGNITLEGNEISEYSIQQLSRKRAVLSQHTPIDFPLTAKDIVMMGRTPYIHLQKTCKNHHIADEALRLVDAYHLKDRILPTLSGGEQQRVHLARVLAQIWQQHNSFLFLDEPTSALDIKHQYQLLKLCQQLKQEYNIGVVCILHDITLSIKYADSILLLQDGNLRYDDHPSKLFKTSIIEDVFEIDQTLFNFSST